jgi:hypothetical protein
MLDLGPKRDNFDELCLKLLGMAVISLFTIFGHWSSKMIAVLMLGYFAVGFVLRRFGFSTIHPSLSKFEVKCSAFGFWLSTVFFVNIFGKHFAQEIFYLNIISFSMLVISFCLKSKDRDFELISAKVEDITTVVKAQKWLERLSLVLKGAKNNIKSDKILLAGFIQKHRSRTKDDEQCPLNQIQWKRSDSVPSYQKREQDSFTKFIIHQYFEQIKK